MPLIDLSSHHYDLFGIAFHPDLLPSPPPHKRKPTQPKGYAAQPGTGPEGETCKTCSHYVRKGGCSRRYLKCSLMCGIWTNGPGTDIKANSPACAKWQAPPLRTADDVTANKPEPVAREHCEQAAVGVRAVTLRAHAGGSQNWTVA